MIRYAKGNVLDAPSFTNTVNLVGAMGAGLARQVALRFPRCVSPYKQGLKDGTLREGTVVSWRKPDGGHILQVPTKRHWRDKSPLELVEASIGAMTQHARALGIEELHTVPLGCGLGGLDWERQVKPLLEAACKDLDDLTVIVHV